jgi:hypothetical protein
MSLVLATAVQDFIYAAINSTNETSKAGGMCHYSVYITYMSMIPTFTLT